MANFQAGMQRDAVETIGLVPADHYVPLVLGPPDMAVNETQNLAGDRSM